MFYDTEKIKIHNENCLATMERMQGDSIDSIICDPPYGLGKAALLERFNFIGSEINTEDCEIAKARIIWASKQYKQMTLFEGLAN